MIKQLKTLFSFLLLFSLVLMVGWFMKNDSTYFVIREVPMKMEVPNDHDIIADMLKPKVMAQVSPLKAMNIWKVDLSDLRLSLMKENWVKDVVLQRTFPDKISVKIIVEEAVVLYRDKKNRFLPVTIDGKTLDSMAATQTPDLPIMVGDLKKTEWLKYFMQVPNHGALKRSNISEISWDPIRGFTLDLINEQARVYLGKENIQTKGLQVLRVTKYLQSQKQKAKVIDASFTKKVLVRPRKGS